MVSLFCFFQADLGVSAVIQVSSGRPLSGYACFMTLLFLQKALQVCSGCSAGSGLSGFYPWRFLALSAGASVIRQRIVATDVLAVMAGSSDCHSAVSEIKSRLLASPRGLLLYGP